MIKNVFIFTLLQIYAREEIWSPKGAVGKNETLKNVQLFYQLKKLNNYLHFFSFWLWEDTHTKCTVLVFKNDDIFLVKTILNVSRENWK